MKLNLFLLFFLFSTAALFSQSIELSPKTTISVLTIGPGTSLNDAFGHNAFRITDKGRGFDIVYGYGEYDFDAPNFYLKFAQGKLNYLISRNNFSDFYYHYQRSNRTIEEQILNLNPEEKQGLFEYLETNYKPENRRYLYDFFYDNCATRIRDVSKTATHNAISFNTPDDFEAKTFRELIHDHVGLNTWGSLGIDIALGSIIDRTASSYEHMFLPKYIHYFFGNATIRGSEDLVKSGSVLFKKKDETSGLGFLFSPLLLLSVIAGFILFRTYKDYKTKTRTKWLDISIAFLTGVIGIVLLLLWFATDHTATAYNYNLLWAFPINMVLISQLRNNKMKPWVKSYLKFLLIMLCLLTLHWSIGVQVFSIALIPILVAILLRYIYLIRTF